MLTLFSQIAVGTRFKWRGEVYTKTALSFAEDERGRGSVFHPGCEVLTEFLAPPPLTSPTPTI